MIKLTVLYGHPADPAEFENYYAATHMPLSAKMSGVLRHEKAKVMRTPTGDKPPYHRIFEAWFESEAAVGAAAPKAKSIAAAITKRLQRTTQKPAG